MKVLMEKELLSKIDMEIISILMFIIYGSVLKIGLRKIGHSLIAKLARTLSL